MNKNTIAIIQVRSSSKRLHNKALIKIDNKHTLLEKIIFNLKRSVKLNKIIIATSTEKSDDNIFDLSKKNNLDCVRGSLDDVLSRFEDTLNLYQNYHNVIRVTGDCPLIDPKVLDFYISLINSKNADMIYSNFQSPLLVGYDCKSVKVYKYLFENCKSKRDREHVGSFLLKEKSNIFNKIKIILPKWLDNQNFKISIDNPEDMKFIQELYKNFSNKKLTSIPNLYKILTNNKNFQKINKKSKESSDNIKLNNLKTINRYKYKVNFIYE